MPLIPKGDLLVFWPNGEGTYPRVEIQRMVRYQPGDPKHSHWNVQIFERAQDNAPLALELRTWREVEQFMTERFGPAFRDQFPTSKDREQDFLKELGRRDRGEGN